jgi:hypothetical protein
MKIKHTRPSKWVKTYQIDAADFLKFAYEKLDSEPYSHRQYYMDAYRREVEYNIPYVPYRVDKKLRKK